MKYLICSDIHGSESAARKIVQTFHEEKCSYLILLGDILYHGPRNPLPEGHNPQGVVEVLNSIASKIIACRGNCDAEVDQMLLKFHMLSDYSFVVDEGIRLFCTHGHVYEPQNASECDVFLSGHTHIQVLEKNAEGIILCNPGSVSLPKGGTPAGYAIYCDKVISLYTLEGQKVKSLSL